MKTTTTSLSSKFNTSSKENAKARSSNPTQIDSNPKLSYNHMSVSARQHFSSLIDSNTTNNLKHQISSSTFASTKLTNSNPSQTAASNTSSKYASRINPQVVLTESKKSLSFGKSPLDNLKSPKPSKSNAESSKLGAFSKKADFFAAAQEFNRSNSKAMTKSQGTSKGESLILEIMSNPIDSRKDRLFGSYEPTPTNSPSRKPFLRTEASGSDRKTQDLDLKDYLSQAKKVTTPSTKLFTVQDSSQGNIDRFNSNRMNHFLNQKIDNFLRAEKSPKNSQMARTGLSSNELRTVSGKSSERPLNKANARLIHEPDYKKQNSSNDSVKLGTKSSASTKSSTNSFKNKANFIQLDESVKSKQISYLNPSICVSPSALYQRLLSKETGAAKEVNFCGSPSHQFKGNYQDAQKIKRDNSEGVSYKKTSTHQAKGSIGSGLSNELTGKGNYFVPKSNPAKSHSIDAEITHNTFKSASGTLLFDEKNLSYSKHPTYTATHTEEVPVHFENEIGHISAPNSIPRSQSSVQMQQENFDFEKKRAEAIKIAFRFISTH